MESVDLCLPLPPQLRLQPHQQLLLQLEGQDQLYQVFLLSVNQLLTAAFSGFYPKIERPPLSFYFYSLLIIKKKNNNNW